MLGFICVFSLFIVLDGLVVLGLLILVFERLYFDGIWLRTCGFLRILLFCLL